MRILKNVLIFFVLIAFLITTFITYLYLKVKSTNLNSVNNITSILILGKGGEGHSAPDLTDTIMMANLSLDKDRISFLPLPRDIWLDSTKAKLNSSYYWGKQKGENDFKLLGTTIQEVSGIRPNYYIVIDFSLFKDIVDVIGGIDVSVENSFVDEKYPIVGKENDLCNGDRTYMCRYEKLEFKSGVSHFDGETALKFVRSRNSTGDEGTDLAREKRQQKVISAVKDKILSSSVLLNPKVVKALSNIIFSHLETNITLQEFYTIALKSYNSRNSIEYLSIPESFLKISQGDKKYGKQYVFLPATGSWKDLHEWINKKI